MTQTPHERLVGLIEQWRADADSAEATIAAMGPAQIAGAVSLGAAAAAKRECADDLEADLALIEAQAEEETTE